ncbi:DNA mismatch repair endonuclease MutL [uncultured Eubacterium sp.]|uniref:DNA mismatch repair endonuclease MutL n=1 Tax=uncultured Eubacterium sp. TaxID=165185 RepID=UPI002673ACF2|nr:DNA mismatch repair endonuclease MutL [uncultured Eubacterium sp.]
MNKIQELDQNTINQIAAGEVVERPASIVKELMENAIDAGATMISVEIEDGGTSLIRITDNGSGIETEDIKIAFLRHTTSKIRTAIDLLSVSSLGFRGEALSSIAAVCQVELITKTKGNLTGNRYKIEGGREILFEEIGAPEGTTFIVKNIFFNTPARRKFLKTPQTEAGYVSDIVEKIALSHPEISISFKSNKQIKVHTAGNGNLKDVIYNIYGRDVTKNIIEVCQENEFMKMTGFIGKAIISKGNRTFENYFINGRYIKSNIISKAIEAGYKFILMQHKYPFTVLNFTINPEYLDVNVHPSKMELRFRKGEHIYPWIEECINDALIEKPNIIDIALEKEQRLHEDVRYIPEPFEKKRQELHKINSGLEEHIWGDTEIYKKPIEKVSEGIDYKVSDNGNTFCLSGNNQNYTDNAQKKENIQKELTDVYDTFLTDIARPKHKLIGQVFGTYWIIEYDNKMYIIDQHAAHEKVMFESLMDKFHHKTISTQMMNPPIILSLSMNEASLLEKYMDNFKEIGFEIEHFGGQDYAVRGVPSDLYTLNSEEVLMEIIDNLSNENARMVPDSITDKIASMSCKAAVKGNSTLSTNEANALIEQLLSLENPYNCPHGRPTIISMSKYELEKKFKRIV